MDDAASSLGDGQYDCLTLFSGAGDDPFRVHLCTFTFRVSHLHIFSTYQRPLWDSTAHVCITDGAAQLLILC